MKKNKIKLFKNKKYLQKIAIFAFVFLLCCTLGAFSPSFNAPKTAHAYNEQSTWYDEKEIFDTVGATGGIYTPLYAFDGFETLEVGEYADGVPDNRAQITDFTKANNRVFFITQTNKIGKRFKSNTIDVTTHYYSGSLTFNFAEMDGGEFALILFPVQGFSGVTPQVYFIDTNVKKQNVSIEFPEYENALENAYSMIAVYKKTAINQYGNVMPVFEGSPKYEAVSKVATLQDYMFYPDALNIRSDKIVWFNAKRWQSLQDSESNRTKIEMTAPVMGVWEWKSNNIDFTNDIYTEENFVLNIGSLLPGQKVYPFFSADAMFSTLNITRSPFSIKYDDYTVLSTEKTDFAKASEKSIYWVQDITNIGTFIDDGASGKTIFLFKNINFYVPAGVDERIEEEQSRFDTVLSLIAGGTIFVLGAALTTVGAVGTLGGTVAPGVGLMVIGAGVAGFGISNASKMGLVNFPTVFEKVNDVIKQLGEEVSKVINQLVKWLWDFIKVLLPGPDKTIAYNLGFVIVAALLLTGLVVAIIKAIKNK